MTKKEAFKKVLAHEEVLPVPYSIKFTVEAKQQYRDYLGHDFDSIKDTGSYVVASHTNNGWEEIKPGYFKDYFGVIWNKTEDKTLGIVDQALLTEPSFGNYQFPNPDEIPVYDFIEKNNQLYPEHFHMVSIGFTLFERAWALTGMTELMMWMIMEQNFVLDLLEQITEYNIKVIENAAELGVDCVHFGDDWGSQNGPMINPDMWREMIKPYFQKTCQAAKAAGLLTSLHSCGNVKELIPDMIECQVDVFDPFQPEAMDIWQLRQEFLGKIAFWGGLSVQKTFPYGTPEDVRKEGLRLLTEMAPGGGYIIAPSHSLSGDVPAKNIKAFLDLVRNQE